MTAASRSLAKCPARDDSAIPDARVALAVVVYLDAFGTAHLPPSKRSPLTRCARVELARLTESTLTKHDRVCTGCKKGDPA